MQSAGQVKKAKRATAFVALFTNVNPQTAVSNSPVFLQKMPLDAGRQGSFREDFYLRGYNHNCGIPIL